MAPYRISNLARDDILTIGQYTQRTWGKAQRRTYLSGLNTRFLLLAENPSLAPDRTEFTPAARLFLYKEHLIVCTPDSNDILIVRVLHRRVNLPEIFN